MKINKRKTMIFAVCFIAVVALGAFLLVQIKDRTYFHGPPYSPDPGKESDALVVYYSRSGNTEAMAREISRKFNADIVKIEAERYTLDYKGWRNAANDADAKVTMAQITPEIVDMKKYRLVFIGAPIWWYRPAPPLWTFVEKNDFKGKNVVLFNTYNSRFKAEEIALFRKEVEKKGGRFIDHIFVRRGRVYFQKSGEELIEESREIIEEKMKEWNMAK
ncbi:MAG: flavodoxin/nitric oxide synthase [Desulfobacterales bacterium]|nr:flavodoxin/nitric oxide synthase [Desulfobacterales bacterium]